MKDVNEFCYPSIHKIHKMLLVKSLASHITIKQVLFTNNIHGLSYSSILLGNFDQRVLKKMGTKDIFDVNTRQFGTELKNTGPIHCFIECLWADLSLCSQQCTVAQCAVLPACHTSVLSRPVRLVCYQML